MAQRFRIKLQRDNPDSLETYGPKVLASLDKLVGGQDSWDMRQWHGIGKIVGTSITVERHEDGPEIIGMVLTAAPKVLTALAALAVAWCKVKGTRRVKVQVGKHKYEGPIDGLPQFKAVLKAVEKLAGS